MYNMHLYEKKQPRYIDPNNSSKLDLDIDTSDPQDVMDEMLADSKVELYRQTGLCKLAIDLQSLLSEIAARGQLTINDVSLDSYSSFTKDIFGW